MKLLLTLLLALLHCSGVLSKFYQPAKPYTQFNIEHASSNLSLSYVGVLIWDGESFTLHIIRNHSTMYMGEPYCVRCNKHVATLAYALQTHFPHRFRKGTPPWQAMYSDDDTLHSSCIEFPESCSDTPPIMAFASTPKESERMPTVQPFPNVFFMECLYHWRIFNKNRPCDWEEHAGIQVGTPWESLKPTIIWRGSDNAFLMFMHRYRRTNSQHGNFRMLYNVTKSTTTDELFDILVSEYERVTPRWKGVILSLQAARTNSNAPWIDTKFTGKIGDDVHKVFNEHGLAVSAKSMNSRDMSLYKYLIDYGGGGGTTWRGTLTKLKMPGVLFHHETFMKDWFYDLMVPWVHYIPVQWDLRDLKEKYIWAESNQEKCKEISRKASELADYIMSTQYMEHVYNDLFIDYLGSMVNAYQGLPPEPMLRGKKALDYIVNQYRKHRYDIKEIAKCQGRSCHFEFMRNRFKGVTIKKQYKD